jgi:hypothetical protein
MVIIVPVIEKRTHIQDGFQRMRGTKLWEFIKIWVVHVRDHRRTVFYIEFVNLANDQEISQEIYYKKLHRLPRMPHPHAFLTAYLNEDILIDVIMRPEPHIRGSDSQRAREYFVLYVL